MNAEKKFSDVFNPFNILSFALSGEGDAGEHNMATPVMGLPYGPEHKFKEGDFSDYKNAGVLSKAMK